MNPRLLDYLADPNDGGLLELRTFEGKDDQTREGVLVNRQTGRWYPIQEGIPTLFADDLRQSGALRESDQEFTHRFRDAMSAAGCHLEPLSKDVSSDASGEARPGGQAEGTGDVSRIESERRARDEQAEDYDRMLSLKVLSWFEVPAYRAALGEDFDSPLFEAGCGTGRFTGVFAELAPIVVALDMSRTSIARNRVRHAGKTASPVFYVHADLTHVPLRDSAFGRIAHCGVYEHIPSRAMREQFLAHSRRVLRPDGTLVLSAYRYAGLTRLFAKDGEHAGGIPFTRFTPDELRAEVESNFRIEKFRANLGEYMSMVVAKPI